LSFSISLTPKNSEKRLLLCSGMTDMIYGLRFKTRAHELTTLLRLIFLVRTSVWSSPAVTRK